MSYQQCDPLLRFLQNVGYHLIGEDRSSRPQETKATSESNGLTPATRVKPTANPQSREASPSQMLHHRFSHVVPDPLHAQRLWKVPEARETTKRPQGTQFRQVLFPPTLTLICPIAQPPSGDGGRIPPP